MCVWVAGGLLESRWDMMGAMIGYELGLKVMLAQTGLQGPIKNVKGPSDAAMPRQNALRLAALLECCLCGLLRL